jgi:hypothetical protein
MAEKTNANALFNAASAGNAARIRELLAAGVPIESQDVNRRTAVMVAAQAGHAEAFHALVDLGANLHALALCDIDLLECAAEGGNIDIVRFLLDQGMPVDGHWKPRSDVSRRMGHFTPMMSAALEGHVEIVRLLLEKGADREAKHDGETALKTALGNIKHPIGEDQAALKPRYQEIVALLKGGPGEARPAGESLEAEVKQFAQNAKRPEFVKFRQMLEEKCGGHHTWRPDPDHGMPAKGVVAFRLVNCQRQAALTKLQDGAREAGCQLVLSEPWAPGEVAKLVLFPTANKFAVVAATGTNGANDSVHTDDIVQWLTAVDEENPFTLVYCGHDMVGGSFQGALKNARVLASRMFEICPSCRDEDLETAEDMAAALKKRKGFFLRWD